MIGHAVDGLVGLQATIARGAQVIEVISDFPADVIETNAPAGERAGRIADLDEQQFVMRVPAREQRGAVVEDAPFDGQADDVAIKRNGAIEVAHIEDDVTEFRHAAILPLWITSECS